MLIRLATKPDHAGARRVIGDCYVQFVPYGIPAEIEYRKYTRSRKRLSERPYEIVKSRRQFATLDAAVAALIKEQA